MNPSPPPRTKTIAALVLTKNEAENIVPCLGSVSWCDQLIIIDDNSTDRTAALARSAGALVYKRALKADFASQRNFGLGKVSCEWAFFIDADERVPESLKGEILASLDRYDYSGYKLTRTDVFLGKRLGFGETASVSPIRLARKSAGSWRRPVHEVWDIKGKVAKLQQPLLHYPHRSISGFIAEINQYTQIEAEFRRERGESTSFVELLLFPIAKFIQNYIFRIGILDGFPGLVMAFMMSLHSLTLRVKVRQKNL